MSVVALSLALAVILLAAPVHAQTLRSVVVGAEVPVVIPPRGAAPPAFPLSAQPAIPPPALMQLPAIPLAAATGLASGAAAGTGLAAVLPILLPLAAAAALGGGLPGSGGSGSAPASTR